MLWDIILHFEMKYVLLLRIVSMVVSSVVLDDFHCVCYILPT